ACAHETTTQLHNGKVSLAQLSGMAGNGGAVERLAMLGRGNWLRLEHVRLLEIMTRCVEISELPPQEQPGRFGAIEDEAEAKPPGRVKLLMPAVLKVAGATQRHHASLRTLIVAVAAERFRKANGRWPESVAELVPVYLADVPLDPYDGKPIRFKRTPEGLVIYCVGRDRADDGGLIRPEARDEPGTDGGGRLWDVGKRRH